VKRKELGMLKMEKMVREPDGKSRELHQWVMV